MKKVWSSFPSSTKQWINKNLRFRARLLTGQYRVLPNFLIIGASKSGTTSLFRYISQHPDYFPAFVKEVHYFDLHYEEGLNWYKAHFPTFVTEFFIKNILNRPFTTGEASPYYLYHLHAPRRAFKTIPNAKIIVLLRNPIDRAYSDYQHTKRDGFELLGFMQALEAEGERLNEEVKKIQIDEYYYSMNHQKYSYLARGVYVDQLQRWMAYYAKDQFLIINSDDFFNDPAKAMYDVTQFLGIPKFERVSFKAYNQKNYSDMSVQTRRYLSNYFQPHNQRLYDFLGKDFGWE